jgi:hypothetical protein
VAIVIALGVYPNFVVHRTERDTTQAIERPQNVAKLGIPDAEVSVNR